MSSSALAGAGFEDQVVAFFGPEVLLALLVRPGSGPADGFEVVQDALLPVLEALAVHELAGGTVVIVADHADTVTEVLRIDGPEV